MTTQFQSVDEAAAHYNKQQNDTHVKKAAEERHTMQQRFSLNDWPQMSLEQYALGQPHSRETYSYWLEFGTPHMGSMRGGTSHKHLIYKHKNKPGWYYRSDYENEQEAWLDLRSAFVRMFELAQADRWDEIGELDALRGARTLKLKSLHLYFPDKILSITSADHLLHFLHRLGVYQDEMKNWGAVRMNRFLLNQMRQISALRDWSTNEIERFLYTWADPRQVRRVVKIAPGKGGRHWQECLANGYICVGWDETGDLREFEAEEAFGERFSEIYSQHYNQHQSTLTKKAREVWTLMELEPGDVVIANRGLSEVLAVGEVVEPGYEWRPERAEHKHTVHVKWDTSYNKKTPLPQYWANVTVAPVGLELAQKLMSRNGRGPKSPLPLPALYPEIAAALEQRGQLILYGPPGTGKTFHARRFAAWWLLQDQGEANAAAVLSDKQQLLEAESRLKTLQIQQRVWWVVANPKEWGWDQLFQDGRVQYRYGRLQRNYPLLQPGDLVVGYQSTPDKRIIALARVEKGLEQSESGEPYMVLSPLRRVSDGPTYAELQADPILSKSEPMRFRCQGTLFALTDTEWESLLPMLTERNPDLEEIAIEGHAVGRLTWVTFHPSYSYEDFIEGFRPVDTGDGGLVLKMDDGLFKRVCREAQTNPQHKYLLLVDEINRANLAKVFGEIITLLEKDKRGLIVTLPQSKESFAIPENVYLLGTMNTADRSIKLMDTALRRRFAFMELMPDLELLAGATVGTLPLDEFLLVLNQRIAQSEGREKQIGHALLLDGEQPLSEPEEFARRFRQEILPLLQEYCYDDFAALADYLGEQIVNRQKRRLNKALLADPERLLEALTAVVNGGAGP
jgi:5-methylcytosine-specific restriction enzyme B